MKKLIILLLSIFMGVLSFANSLEGIGQGTTQDMAKKEALADLSSQIQVTVRSNFTSHSNLSNGKTNKEMSSQISTLSEIKILGVDFNVKKKWFRSQYTATAKLEESKITLYEKKLEELKNKINSSIIHGAEVEDLKLKKNYYLDGLKNYEEFESYRNVAIILGSTKQYYLSNTKTEIKNKLQSIEIELNNDSLYNGINILYVKSSGKFEDISKKYFDNSFNTILAEISQENQDKVAISNQNDSTVTTLVKVVLNSSNNSITPAVFYNKKMITPDTNVATISVTVELYNKKKIENLLTITVTGRGSDINSSERAYEKAVKNGLSQMKEKLEKALVGE